ncbi:MAG: hypothetical protein N2235_05635 [Fischerella sp.]|nr:hypothetical protein [Fischerella sp.]
MYRQCTDVPWHVYTTNNHQPPTTNHQQITTKRSHDGGAIAVIIMDLRLVLNP